MKKYHWEITPNLTKTILDLTDRIIDLRLKRGFFQKNLSFFPVYNLKMNYFRVSSVFQSVL